MQYLHAMRLFKAEPSFAALHRGEETDGNKLREEYLELTPHGFPDHMS